ncbi:hypothetical protein [Candidatus Phytoplasma oryzae]|nr:hypothetical protein PIE28_00450 [Candidatus Phytoplasma oryzae]
MIKDNKSYKYKKKLNLLFLIFVFIFVFIFIKNNNYILSFALDEENEKQNNVESIILSSQQKISKEQKNKYITLEKKKYIIIENILKEQNDFQNDKSQEYYFKIYSCKNDTNEEQIDFIKKNNSNSHIFYNNQYHKLYKEKNLFIDVEAKIFFPKNNNETQDEKIKEEKNITKKINIEMFFKKNNSWQILKNKKMSICEGQIEFLIILKKNPKKNKNTKINLNYKKKFQLLLEFDLVNENNNIICKEIEKSKIINHLELENKNFIKKNNNLDIIDKDLLLKIDKEHLLIDFTKDETIQKELKKFDKFELYEDFKKNILYYNQKLKYNLFFCYLNDKNQIIIKKYQNFKEISENYLQNNYAYINEFINIKNIKKIFIIWPKTIYCANDYKTYSDAHWIFYMDNIGTIETFEKHNWFTKILYKILSFVLNFIYIIIKDENIKKIQKELNKDQKYLINLHEEKILLQQKKINECRINLEEKQKIKIKIINSKENKKKIN